MTPGGPSVAGAFLDDTDGTLTVQGTEDLVLTDPNPAAWQVTFDGVPQPISSVFTIGTSVALSTTAGSAAEMFVSYIGGAYVIGEPSGLPLQAVTDFPVALV